MRRFYAPYCYNTVHFSPAFRVDFFDFERETGKNAHIYPQEKHANIPPERTKCMKNSNRERKRILLVEDEGDARELAELTLKQYTLIYARDFNDGLLAARRGYFDLYILDNWLPGGSGAELSRLICGFDPYAPILIYSAAVYERDIQECLRAGAQAYLVKPVFPDNLERVVAQLISTARKKVFEARQAELAAVLEELAIRQMENAERLKKAKQKHLRAEEKVLRDKAMIAFIAAGGTRGEFAREWPSVFTEELRGQRKSDAASGH